jgi:Helicase HerA, central domain
MLAWIPILILLLAGILGLSLVAIVVFKHWGQFMKDSERVTYELTFPADLKLETASLLFESLMGIFNAPSKLPNLVGEPSIAFEIMATEGKIAHLLSFPPDLEATIRGHLRGVIPTLGFEQVQTYPRRWTHVLELRVREADEPPNANLIGALLSSFGELRENETVLAQFVMAPVPPLRYVEAGPKYKLIGRVGATGHDIRAKELLQRVLRAYSSLRVVTFRPPLVIEKHHQLNNRETPIVWVSEVSSEAVAVVCGLPIGKLAIPGLKQGLARPLPPDRVVPSQGFVIGVATASGYQRPIALSSGDLNTHIDIIGKTGTGKSVLMSNLAIAQMEEGHGVCILDPHGPLVNWTLERIPHHRLNDVIVIEPGDESCAVPFNIFNGPVKPEHMADEVLAIFAGIYRDTTGVFNSNYLHGAVQALASVDGMTLIDVPKFLTDKRFRSSVMDQVDDLYLSSLWDEFDSLSPKQAQPLVQPGVMRVQPFLRRKSVRLMLGQSDNRLDMREIIRGRKILLVSLPGRFKDGTAELLGSLLFNQLWAAAVSQDPVPFFVHMDEAQRFMKTSHNLDQLLDEARKFWLSLCMAHPTVGAYDIPPAMRQAIHRSTRTKMAFQLSADDSAAVAREFGPPVMADDIAKLGKREFILQTVVDEQTTVPMTVRSADARPKINDAEEIRRRSKDRWTRPEKVIDAAILARQATSKNLKHDPTKPTVVGWEDENDGQ